MTYNIEYGIERPRMGGKVSEEAQIIAQLATAPTNSSVFFPKKEGRELESMRGSLQAMVLKHGSGWASIYKANDGVRVFKNAEPKRLRVAA